uniref:netrin-G2 isoform X2 n=1 Tax=Ciona intestinalis TaxID=7719 RepID=UPI000EF4F12A|nr:netrin-G2 isoform X2 [Ciona intestinalis]|eukprot:XP_026692234.1 netrin-G2 isoform X2 [Ciona intestinalis]
MRVFIALILLNSNASILAKLLQCLNDVCSERGWSGLDESIPRPCEPRNDMLNVAETGTVTVEPSNATCGFPKRSKFCSLKNHLSCLSCDSSRKDLSHDPNHMIDAIKWTWWQSKSNPGPPGRPLEVNVSIALPMKFILTDDVIIDFYDGRPQVMMVEKSSDHGITWLPLQYFADNCLARFGMPAKDTESTFSTFTEALSPFCTEDCSINDSWDSTDITRVSVSNRLTDLLILGLEKEEMCGALENNTLGLRSFLEITNLRIRLIRPPVMQWNKSNGKQSHLSSSYHYGIKKVQINARCQCNGHASSCVYEGKSARCECQHDTVGKQCEKCRPLFWMTSWRQGSFFPKRERGTANPCLSSYSKWYRDKLFKEVLFTPNDFQNAKALQLPEPCQCNKHSERCELVSVVGMLCVDCRHNTEGENCHRCKNRFYRNANVPINDTRTCKLWLMISTTH